MEPVLDWRPAGRDYWRDTTGRFEVMYAPRPAPGYWVALDAELGRVARRPSMEAAQAWCAEQLQSRGAA